MLLSSRAGVATNGIEPAGMAAARASDAATPIAEAMAVTTRACTSTPANSVAELAPIAFSTP